MSIAVSSDLSAAVIRNLADPAASLGAEPPGLGPEPAAAEGGELAAVALAKLASLLPAALVLPLARPRRRWRARRTDIAVVDTDDGADPRDAAMAGLEPGRRGAGAARRRRGCAADRVPPAATAAASIWRS